MDETRQMFKKTWVAMKIAKEETQEEGNYARVMASGTGTGAAGVVGMVAGPLGVAIGGAAMAAASSISLAFAGIFGNSKSDKRIVKLEKDFDYVYPTLSAELLPVLERKWIPRTGGIIESGGCKVSFPHDHSYDVEHFTMFGTHLLPDDCFPIGRVLALEINKKLEKPVKVEIESFCTSYFDVEVTILHLAENATSWQSIKTMPLSDDEYVEFECRDFSIVAAVVRGYHSFVGYRIKSLLYGKGPNFRFFFFCKSSARKESIMKEMRENGYSQLFDYDPITVKYRDLFGASFEYDLCESLMLRSDNIKTCIQQDFQNTSYVKTFDLTLSPKPSVTALPEKVGITSELFINSKVIGSQRCHTYVMSSEGSARNVFNIHESTVGSVDIH